MSGRRRRQGCTPCFRHRAVPGQIRRLPMLLYQMVTQENYRGHFFISYQYLTI